MYRDSTELLAICTFVATSFRVLLVIGRESGIGRVYPAIPGEKAVCLFL